MSNLKFNLPKTQGTKMAGIKELVGKKMSKKYKFMDAEITINKLSVSEVMKIQEEAKEAANDEAKGLNILKTIIRSSVADATELSDEDFAGFPMDELSRLSNEIMKFSGITGGEEQKGKS
jgi:hypothetical protein